jgi:hypothetical protein
MRWINGDVFDARGKIKRGGGPIQTWRRQVATEMINRPQAEEVPETHPSRGDP